MLSTLPLRDLFPRLGDPLAESKSSVNHTLTHEITQLPAIRPAYSLPRLDEGGTPRGLLELNQRQVLLSQSQGSSKPGTRELAEVDCKLENKEISSLESAKNDVQLDDLDIWTAAAEFPFSASEASEFKPREFKTWSCKALALITTPASPFISESSTASMDALLPTVDAEHSAEYVKQHISTTTNALHLLMRSTLGTTETTNLKWDVEQSAYIWDGRIEGIDSVQSRSMSKTFLDVATCMRRLETLCDRGHQQADTSTHHALFHALSTYLTYIRHRLDMTTPTHLLRASQTLQDARQVLEALCDLMNWPLSSTSPSPLSSQPVKIINSIYGHLAASLLVPTSIASPSQLALAHLLERASQPWLDTVHQWVGLKPALEDEQATNPWSIIGVEQHKSPAGYWEYTYHSKRVPAFVSKQDGRRIYEAGRSLRLLARSTGGQHPLLGRDWDDVVGAWPWRDGSADVDLDGHLRSVRHSLRKPRIELAEGIAAALPTAPSELPFYAQSGLRDLDKPLQDNPLWQLFSAVPTNPGDGVDHLTQAQPSNLWQSTSSYDQLLEFLDSHADQPLISLQTSTLITAIHADLLSMPIAHGSLASQSLLTHFLQDLKLLDHLAILRAFFLGGDVAFTDRVRAALFGDGQVDGQAVGVGRRARTRMRLGLGHEEDQLAANAGVWGVGLAIGLSDRQCWPPGGTELSYALRTTLVDIEEKSISAGTAGVCEEVWQEVDERLSFAVKDLDETDGEVQARWMDPQAIEALDFLYLSYDPPSVVSVLLTPEIIGKFQTVFSFLLRLSRVETVLRSIYNDVFHLVPAEEQPIKQGVDAGQSSRRSRTALSSAPRAKHTIFRAQPTAQATLHRLRFRMSHVIAAFSQYVLDSAIARNWDIFMRRMERLKQSSRRSEADEDDGFGLDEDPDEGVLGGDIKDIHALVLYHHHVLDRIVKGCLLGPSAGQQALQRILMGLFGVILNVGKLVKEVAMRQVGEDEGASRMTKLNSSWCEREEMLLHALEKLSARSGPRGTVDDEDEDLAMLLKGEDGHDGTSFDGGLGELLLRLQLSKPRAST